jgi:hypothetical protein
METPITIEAVISNEPPLAGEVYIGDVSAEPIRLLRPSGLTSGAKLTRVELELQPIVREMGDAPDPTYPTLTASDGARHDGDDTLMLGATRDVDFDGQPSVAADGDGDDEDGVVATSTVRVNLNPTMTTLDVTASAPPWPQA